MEQEYIDRLRMAICRGCGTYLNETCTQKVLERVATDLQEEFKTDRSLWNFARSDIPEEGKLWPEGRLCVEEARRERQLQRRLANIDEQEHGKVKDQIVVSAVPYTGYLR